MICPDCNKELKKVEIRFRNQPYSIYKVWICACSNMGNVEEEFQTITKRKFLIVNE